MCTVIYAFNWVNINKHRVVLIRSDLTDCLWFFVIFLLKGKNNKNLSDEMDSNTTPDEFHEQWITTTGKSDGITTKVEASAVLCCSCIMLPMVSGQNILSSVLSKWVTDRPTIIPCHCSLFLPNQDKRFALFNSDCQYRTSNVCR